MRMGRNKGRPNKRRRHTGESTDSASNGSDSGSPKKVDYVGDSLLTADAGTSEQVEGNVNAQLSSPTTKSAIETLLTCMGEIKSGQNTLRNSLNSRIDKLRNEILEKFEKQATDITTYVDSKLEDGLNEMKRQVDTEVKKLDENMAALLRRVETVEEQSRSLTTRVDARSASQNADPTGDNPTQRELKYKQMDLEARSRRNNPVFFNMPENEREDTPAMLKSFIRDRLGIEQNVALQRAHRLGGQRAATDGRSRPVIACFRDYPDVDQIMSRAGRLRGTRLGISRDYPEEIRRARARLQAGRRQAKEEGKNAVIAYPAKLIVDGVVVRNEFPDWKNAGREGYRSDGH